MKPFCQTFEVLRQRGDFINSKLARPKLISAVKKEVVTSLSENWTKKTHICISRTTIGKSIKSRGCNNLDLLFFFWRNDFSILKNWSLSGVHYSKTGTIMAELACEMRFSFSWNCRRFWSLIQLATLQKSYFQGNLFVQNTINAILHALNHYYNLMEY